ncbi:V-type sodium ATPase subunit C [bioreactor metagenome]|uniref:V-type sodium ATPase subunit C n=1 Tax=bioreactor metagenome TaxID=1076179 RepID=A0A645AB13_9ZZZZ
MPKNEREDYIFATARVRSVEKNLLTREKITKMIDSKTADEALKVLSECHYSDENAEVSGGDFEILLVKAQKELNEFIKKISPNPETFDLFLYVYDYHNLKVLLKSEFLQSDDSKLLVDGGTIPVSKLKILIHERNYLPLTENMKKALVEALDTFSRTNDPQQIDIIMDRACFEDMIKCAKDSESKFVTGYVKTLIDVTNIKSFVRVRKMGKAWDFFTKIFIGGGSIAQKLFIASFDEPLEQFGEKLSSYGYEKVISSGAESLKVTGKFTELERQCDNRLIEYVKSAKYISFGIEPLVGYMVAKDSEIKTVRIIMSGKIADLSADKIKERLRDTYV